MYLTHQEKEKMLLLFAAIVAKNRKEKGLKLSYPEAVAYLSGHVIEGAREGKTVQQLIEECNQLLTTEDVMHGVPELIEQLQVEAMFVDGTKLVSLNNPINGRDTTLIPGAYEYAEDDISLSEGRKRLTIKVINTADRPVQVGSHFHFYEVNPALDFDRAQTKGYHLDIASGLSVRFMPGVEETIDLVSYGGAQIIHGFTGKINGSV
ncbi:urease subunit beta [Myroides odoratus]|uniref:urease subunit beta n=1 Tax=Myroides odoratus TaxID=256 RepID=UPI00333E4862